MIKSQIKSFRTMDTNKLVSPRGVMSTTKHIQGQRMRLHDDWGLLPTETNRNEGEG